MHASPCSVANWSPVLEILQPTPASGIWPTPVFASGVSRPPPPRGLRARHGARVERAGGHVFYLATNKHLKYNTKPKARWSL